MKYPVHNQLHEWLSIESGGEARGSIQRPSDNETPALDFSSPRLTLKVRNESLVRTGQIVRRRGGNRYLVADHGGTGDYRTHWLFQCNREVQWERVATANDALTGLPQATGSRTSLGSLWVVSEMITREDFDRSLRTREEKYRIITGANVIENDLIDGLIVKRVNPVLGVRVLTIQ